MLLCLRRMHTRRCLMFMRCICKWSFDPTLRLQPEVFVTAPPDSSMRRELSQVYSFLLRDQQCAQIAVPAAPACYVSPLSEACDALGKASRVVREANGRPSGYRCRSTYVREQARREVLVLTEGIESLRRPSHH